MLPFYHRCRSGVSLDKYTHVLFVPVIPPQVCSSPSHCATPQERRRTTGPLQRNPNQTTTFTYWNTTCIKWWERWNTVWSRCASHLQLHLFQHRNIWVSINAKQLKKINGYNMFYSVTIYSFNNGLILQFLLSLNNFLSVPVPQAAAELCGDAAPC